MKTPARHILETLLAKLDPATAGDLKQAYFKAAEGLQALQDTLEKADTEAGGNTVFLKQHFAACAANDMVSATNLGQVL